MATTAPEDARHPQPDDHRPQQGEGESTPPDGNREPAEPTTTWAERHRDDFVVAAIFGAARILFIASMGVRMDLGFLTYAPQMPDTGLLRHHLLQTILYEHTEPPLFSTFVGLLLKFSPFPDGITFQVVYLGLGLVLALVVFRIARMIGLGRVASFVAIGLVVTNPGLVALEFNASYDEPTALFVAVLVWAVGRYVTGGGLRYLRWAAVAAAAAVLTRTVFHPAWYLFVVLGLLALRPPKATRRQVAVALIAPALVILAFAVKNEVIYGEATLSTFSGSSLAKIAGSASRPDEQKRLIAAGTVSPLFGRAVFWGYSVYRNAMPPCRPSHAHVGVLATELRPDNGTPNLNYECFLPVYRLQSADGRAYLLHRPARFLAAEADGVQMFFEPPMPIVFTANAPNLRAAESFYDWTLFPRVQLQPFSYSDFAERRVFAAGGIEFQPTAVLLDVGVILIGLAQIRRLVRGRRRPGGGSRRQGAAAWAAMGLVCAWVTAIGSLFEINENARYRLLIEPYLLLLLALVLERAAAFARARFPVLR